MSELLDAIEAGRTVPSAWDGTSSAPVALVRDQGGTIRGFVNVCRQRAHPLVLDEECRNTLQCHYHGCTHDLDGSLRNAPRSKEEPEFDPAALALAPIQMHVWGPMTHLYKRIVELVERA